MPKTSVLINMYARGREQERGGFPVPVTSPSRRIAWPWLRLSLPADRGTPGGGKRGPGCPTATPTCSREKGEETGHVRSGDPRQLRGAPFPRPFPTAEDEGTTVPPLLAGRSPAGGSLQKD